MERALPRNDLGQGFFEFGTVTHPAGMLFLRVLLGY